MSTNLLTTIPLFSNLDKKSLDSLAERAVTRSFPKNSVIISEGGESDSLYLIISGRLRVYVSDEAGRNAVLNELASGDYFGELALLVDSPRSASVECIENCKLSIISRALFEEFLLENQQIAIELLRGMALRFQSMIGIVKSLSLMDVYGRVAKLLTDVAQEENGRLITGKLTHQDIANRVGSSREMVSRILKDLKIGGYIDIDEGKRIVINHRLPDSW